MDGWDIISAEEKEDLQRMVKETGVKNIPDYISRKTKQWKDVHINIAIVGETYVGKSTFINQLRGLKEWDNGFASVGLGDTTLEPTPYENPYNANMVCWDLPGVGTLRFPKDDSYLETIKIDRYDFFVIISDACFSENDAWLARNILNRGKPFSLVRTKLDEAMTNASYDGHKMEEVIPRIYKSCYDNLRKANIREPKIFVISNYEHEIGQFDDLMNAVFESLPDQKREAMVLSVGPLTHQIIREKKKSLHKRVFMMGVISAGASAVPFPGVDVVADLAIIAHEIYFYMNEFGLDEESLRHLCKKTEIQYDQIIESLTDAKGLLKEKTVIKRLFMEVVKNQAGEKMAGKFAKYIPLIGTIVSCTVSYGACIHFLRHEIDLLEKDAHTIIDLVIDKTVKK